jgi:hypothetical protein
MQDIGAQVGGMNMNGRTRRPSAAIVIACLALFAALSTGSYAAIQANKVGAKQIKTNAVRADEIRDGQVGADELADDSVDRGELRDNAVGSAEVENGVLSGDDVLDEGLTGGELQNGSVGSDDVQGLTRGDFAAGELPGPVTVQRTDVALADDTTQGVEASCPAGQQAIAGGSSVDQTGSDDIKLLVSRPGNGGYIPADNETFNDWRAVYRNPAGGTAAAEIRAFVICMVTS